MRKNWLTFTAIALVLGSSPAFSQTVHGSAESTSAVMTATASMAPLDAGFDELLRGYASSNPSSFQADEKFVKGWANRYFCKEYFEKEKNEFDFPALLERARADMAKTVYDKDQIYRVVTGINFGSYDSTAGEFPLGLVKKPEDSYLLTFDTLTGDMNVRGLQRCTQTLGANMPRRIALKIWNASVINGIKMPMDEAKAFLAKFPNRQVNLQLGVTISNWGKLDTQALLYPRTKIVNAALLDNKGNTIYTFDDAALAASNQLLEAKISESGKLPAEVTLENLHAWADKLKGIPVSAFPDGTPLREFLAPASTEGFSTQGQGLSYTNHLRLKTAMGSRFGNGTSMSFRWSDGWADSSGYLVEFTNSAQFAGALPLSPEVAGALANGRARSQLYFIPESYDGTLMPKIMARILRVEIFPLDTKPELGLTAGVPIVLEAK
jgi:hypothetical protein